METIKEEKKAELEQLLNSLIEKGWKPFGEKGAFVEIHRYPNWEITTLDYWITWTENPSFFKWNSSIRDLVSKSSWLWQFVCENGMVKKEWNSEWIIIYPNERTGDYQKYHSYCKWQSEYWILESSLKDESELEDFLLQNIKIEWEEQRHS